MDNNFDVFEKTVKLTPEQKHITLNDFGGSPIYIPKITKESRKQRNEIIIKLKYESGKTIGQISRLLQISQRTIYRILEERD